MQVSVEAPGGLERRLKITVPAAEVETAVKGKLNTYKGKVKVAGFRPGKVPMQVLQQKFGDQARYEVANSIIESSYAKALEEQDLKPAGRPNIELGKLEPESDLEYTATFDVYPDVALKGLDKIKVDKPQAEIGEEDIERMMDSLKEQQKTFEEVDRACEDGDQVKLDFVGRLDGEAFDGGSGQDVPLVLGQGRFLPELEKGIVGHKKDETFTVPVTFPDDYQAVELQGKKTEFEVTIKSIEAPKTPEIDEAFIKAAGIEEGTVEALREKIVESLERERERATADNIKQQIMDGLLEANTLDLPRGLIEQEIASLRHEAMQRLPEETRKEVHDDAERARSLFPDELFKASAEKRVALGLLIAQVIEDNKLELDQDKVTSKLEDLSKDYGESEAVIQYYRSNPQMMQGIEAAVMEEQVVDCLLAQAKVKDKKTTLKELLNPEG